MLPPFSTLKREAVYSSKVLENLYQTMQCHVPEDSNVHSHSHEGPQILHIQNSLLRLRLHWHAICYLKQTSSADVSFHS